MPANTPRGYPYPLPTEPVAEGAQAIRNLAEAIDAKSAIDLIQSKTLGAAGPLSFTAIPQIYSDLRLVARMRSTIAGSAEQIRMLLNGSSAASYYYQRLWGAAAAAAADSADSQPYASVGSMPAAGDAAPSKFALLVLDIADYREPGFWRHWIGHCFTGQSAGGWAMLVSGLWANTAAITQIDLTGATGANLVTGSSARLYGIR